MRGALIMSDDEDDDLFAEDDGQSAAKLFGVMHLLDETSTVVSAESLSAMLASGPTAISLSKQDMGSAGAALLTDALTRAAHPSTTVTLLSLDQNDIGDDGLQSLAAANPVKVLPSLEELHLSSNGIGAAGLKKIFDSLNNSCVRKRPRSFFAPGRIVISDGKELEFFRTG